MAFYEWKDINGKSYCYLRTSYRDGKEKVKHQTLGYLGSTEKAYYNGCGQCQYCGTESELWFSMCANCLADLVENEEEKASSLKAGDFEKRNRQGLCHSCLTISSPVYCWKEKEKRNARDVRILGPILQTETTDKIILCPSCYKKKF